MFNLGFVIDVEPAYNKDISKLTKIIVYKILKLTLLLFHSETVGVDKSWRQQFKRD